jgi:hypothetical protein
MQARPLSSSMEPMVITLPIATQLARDLMRRQFMPAAPLKRD